MHNRADVEDATQDALTKAWACRGTFDGRCSWSTWLFRVGVTVALDRVRREAGRDRLPTMAAADDGVALVEARDEIRHVCERLNARDLGILVLEVVEGGTQEAKARAGGVCVSTYKTRVFNMRQRARG